MLAALQGCIQAPLNVYVSMTVFTCWCLAGLMFTVFTIIISCWKLAFFQAWCVEPFRLKGVKLKQNNTYWVLQQLAFWRYVVSNWETWYLSDSVSYWRGVICMSKYVQHLCNASWPTWDTSLCTERKRLLSELNQNFSFAYNLISKQSEIRQRVKIVSGRPWIAVGRLI